MNHASHEPGLKQAANALLVATFFMLLWLPTLDTFLHFDHAAAFNEKRLPAQFPRFNQGLQEYVNGLEAYFNDHFGCRNQLVNWHLTLFNTGRSDVMMGRQGWLYFDENHMYLVKHYQGILQFSPQELADLQTLQERRRDWLARRGIQYLFVIAPDKQSIYPEYLPSWLKFIRPNTKLDQFITCMRVHSTVLVPDLRPALREAKLIAPTYYQTDSHWNSFGGFVSCEEMIKSLSKQMPGLKPLTLDSFEVNTVELDHGDLALLLGVHAIEEDRTLVPKTNLPALVQRVRNPEYVVSDCFTDNSNAAGSAVVFGDSLSQAWIPFLGYHFQKVGYYRVPGGFDTKIIAETKPNVVISEIVERHFNTSDLTRVTNEIIALAPER